MHMRLARSRIADGANSILSSLQDARSPAVYGGVVSLNGQSHSKALSRAGEKRPVQTFLHVCLSPPAPPAPQRLM